MVWACSQEQLRKEMTMGREVQNPALRNLCPKKWRRMKRISILEEKVCALIPTRLGAIENQGEPEDSQIVEAIRSHTLDHCYGPRDLMDILSC
jgi:hypothetical protein